MDFIWTGGRLSGDKQRLSWANGVVESVVRGRHPWSHTGLRGPQPDGRGSEHCLAILNNLYNVRRLMLNVPLIFRISNICMVFCRMG